MIDDLYRELILEHYRCPLGQRPVLQPDRQAAGQNPVCGDECVVAIRLEGDRVAGVEYRARGCSISVASGSMMVGEIEGRTLEEVRRLDAAVRAMLQGRGRVEGVDLGDLESLEGVARFPVRVKCALLPWTTLDEALDHDPAEHRPPATTEVPGETAPAASGVSAGGRPGEGETT
jgi:nitrogen fixation NifU-like protein